MAVELAIEHLLRGVAEQFEADGAEVPQLFGWRKPPTRLEPGQRVIWVPGDDESGDLGELAPARHPGRNPRPLATLRELFTVYLCAYDPTQPESEAAQYRAARLLWSSWYRAIHRTAYGTFRIQRARWFGDNHLRRNGATIRVLLTLEAAITENLQDVLEAHTGGAEITVEFRETAEQISIPASTAAP